MSYSLFVHQRFILRKQSSRPLNFPLLVDDLRKQHFKFSFCSDNVRMTQFSFTGVLIVVLNSQEIFNSWFHSERKSTNIGIPKWPIAMQKLHARAVTRAWILCDKRQSDEHYWEENFEEQLQFAHHSFFFSLLFVWLLQFFLNFIFDTWSYVWQILADATSFRHRRVTSTRQHNSNQSSLFRKALAAHVQTFFSLPFSQAAQAHFSRN